MTRKLPIRSKECNICHRIFQFKNIRAKYCSPKCKSIAGVVWAHEHPGYMVKAQRRYLENPIHKEHKDTYQKDYRHQEKSINRARTLVREKYKNNLAYRERVKAYARANREHYRINHTREQWEALKQVYGNRCAYCGRKMKRLTKDHIIPITVGDPQTVDLISNIIPACQVCNSRKSNKTPPSYQPILATYIIMPP